MTTVNEETGTTQSPVVRVIGEAPERAHESDAGFDLSAKFEDSRGRVFRPGEIDVFETETLGLELPENVAAMIVPRSGLASTSGITVLNGPGLIDPGYQGPIGVCLHHVGRLPVHIKPGDRIAQLVFVPIVTPTFETVDSFEETSERGEGGFGSTGLSDETKSGSAA